MLLQTARMHQYSTMLQQQRRDQVASDPVLQQVSDTGDCYIIPYKDAAITIPLLV